MLWTVVAEITRIVLFNCVDYNFDQYCDAIPSYWIVSIMQALSVWTGEKVRHYMIFYDEVRENWYIPFVSYIPCFQPSCSAALLPCSLFPCYLADLCPSRPAAQPSCLLLPCSILSCVLSPSPLLLCSPTALPPLPCSPASHCPVSLLSCPLSPTPLLPCFPPFFLGCLCFLVLAFLSFSTEC